MYTYVHDCMWSHVCHNTHVEGRRQPQGSVCFLPCLSQGLCAPHELAGKSTTTSNLTIDALYYSWAVLHPASGGSRDPNSGPHLCSVSALTIESSPEPPLEGLRVPWRDCGSPVFPWLCSHEVSIPTVRCVTLPRHRLLPCCCSLRDTKPTGPTWWTKAPKQSKSTLLLYKLIISGFHYSYTKLTKSLTGITCLKNYFWDGLHKQKKKFCTRKLFATLLTI